MGLSNFLPTAEGMLILQVLVMNTAMWMGFLKNMVRSVVQMVSLSGRNWGCEEEFEWESGRERRIWNSKFKCLRQRLNCGRENENGCVWRRCVVMAECCVCLCGFEDDEEVSELSCNHFFHKTCLLKWFDNHHFTCPLCRSIH